jgi:hypothetical protein
MASFFFIHGGAFFAPAVLPVVALGDFRNGHLGMLAELFQNIFCYNADYVGVGKAELTAIPGVIAPNTLSFSGLLVDNIGEIFGMFLEVQLRGTETVEGVAVPVVWLDTAEFFSHGDAVVESAEGTVFCGSHMLVAVGSPCGKNGVIDKV